MDNTISFSTTPYTGFEDEVLHLRNQNRQDLRSRDYIDWRYHAAGNSSSPLIFWAHDQDGSRIGMASLIFRPYWINNQLSNVAILGDISLNKGYRGLGIGKQLFQYINSYIDRNVQPCGFVIPNAAARKSLTSAGWQEIEPLIAHVYPIDPSGKISAYVNNKYLALAASRLIRCYYSLRISVYNNSNLKSDAVNGFDEDFDRLWQMFLKNNLILRDRSRTALHWRYSLYGNNFFRINKFFIQDSFIGYVVYTIQHSICFIYDMLTLRIDYIKPIIAHFVRTLQQEETAQLIRITINRTHPYAPILSRCGFVRRNAEGLFQIYVPSPYAKLLESNQWFITLGDKDA